MRIVLVALLTVFVTSQITEARANSMNGFDLGNSVIPTKHISKGGPPRDGIPALFNPATLAAKAADYMSPDDRVLGVVVGNTARAYPIAILNWHEVVNDQIDDQHFVVTYCPLCGTGMVFGTNIEDNALLFGVSGLLYNSDVLIYDLQTKSLWSQILGQAISGPLVKTPLPQIPARHTTWAAWEALHPNTTVLSNVTGYRRNYDHSPYQGYERSRQLYFKVVEKAPRTYHPKALVMGIELDGLHKAYPFKELRLNGKPSFQNEFNRKLLTILWDDDAQSAVALGENGKELPVTIGYWFAWYAHFPQTEVYTALDG